MNIPRPEYPRPRLVRDTWQNLNGTWDFYFDFGDSGKYRKLFLRDNYCFDKKIVVPFVPESKLSGIEYVDFIIACWYRRSFTVSEDWDTAKGRVLLHVGAADFESEVWVNEKLAGSHKGGFTPFSFDVTDLLTEGDNELVIRCRDNCRDPLQYTGKQVFIDYYNRGCDYTRCTGIWQTVWLEYVPNSYIENVHLTPDVDNEKLHVKVKLGAYAKCGDTVTATASFGGEHVTTVTAAATGKSCIFSMDIKDPVLWELGKGNLYDLELTYGEDKVKTYFGMRKVSINGKRFELNGKSVFQRLVLDQGYYPDGIYTAPTVDELENDIKMSMKVGFNGARLHMKIFEPYTLYFADKYGYMVWGEFPNWGLKESRAEALDSMLPAWVEEIERDYSSPAIIGWCPFNETSDSRRKELLHTVYNVTKALDPYRPVIDTSGYTHGDLTDIYDVHDYNQDPAELREHHKYFVTGEGSVFINRPDDEHYDGQPYFVSEMGGIYWNLDEGDGKKAWGYGNAPKTLEEFYERFEGQISAFLDNPGICGLCYTQLTDVYQEKNGIYAFDRREKFDSERLYKIMTKKAAIED